MPNRVCSFAAAFALLLALPHLTAAAEPPEGIHATATDAADAGAQLPGAVTRWLVGRLVTDGKLAYVVTRADATVEQDRNDREMRTHTKLDVVALYPLGYEAPAYGDNSATPVDAGIPSDSSCGTMLESTSRFDDRAPFLVLKDDAFVALNTATANTFANLAPLAAGTPTTHPIRLGDKDLGKLHRCATDLLARIAKQPLAKVELGTGDTLLAQVPVTPDAEWTADTLGTLSKIVITPKSGSAADYSIDVSVNSKMVCNDLVLVSWKHGRSIPWLLQRSGNTFEVNDAPLGKEAPKFPTYTTAELQAGIEDARRFWNIDQPVDPASCHDMLTGETYTIRKGGQIAQRIEVGYAKPAPIVPFDCESDDKRASLAVHVASDLGYPISGWNSSDYMLCKAMPDKPGTAILALAVLQKGSEDPEGSGDGLYDLDVSLVDMRTRQVLARSLQKAAFTSDAWRFSGVQIDTGRYSLAKNVRAFGIRATSGPSSRYTPAEDRTLSLYVREGERLRSVGGLLTYAVRGENSDSCTSTLSTLERTIDVAATASHGFADLIVTSRIINSTEHDDNGNCKSIENVPTVTRTTLHYDGEHYVIADALSQFP